MTRAAAFLRAVTDFKSHIPPRSQRAAHFEAAFFIQEPQMSFFLSQIGYLPFSPAQHVAPRLWTAALDASRQSGVPPL